MFLSVAMRRHNSMLRADLHQYYGVCLDDMGGRYRVSHVAALAANLPNGSRVLKEMNPKTSYSDGDWLLLGILNSLRNEPFDPFEEVEVSKASAGYDAAEYERLLKLPRKEVSVGD